MRVLPPLFGIFGSGRIPAAPILSAVLRLCSLLKRHFFPISRTGSGHRGISCLNDRFRLLLRSVILCTVIFGIFSGVDTVRGGCWQLEDECINACGGDNCRCGRLILHIDSGSGKVYETSNYYELKDVYCPVGSEVTIIASPDPRYTFGYWKGWFGNISSRDAEYTFFINDDFDLNLYAVFTADPGSGDGGSSDGEAPAADPEPEKPVFFALPEDEIGAYALLKDGTKEYLLFHTYDICMAWLGSDELCSGPERCFHKDGK